MRKFIIASLIMGQIASPAAAAGFGDQPAAGQRDVGTFAGARVRLPLGGGTHEKLRAALTVAPTVQNQSADGRRRVGFGQGMELSFAGGEAPRLSLAGMQLRNGRLAAAEGNNGQEKREHRGPPTWLLVGGGVVLALGIGLALVADAFEDASE